MKKRLLILTTFMLFATYGFSQFEVKTNPLSAMFGTIPVSIEYVAAEKIGLEGTVGYYFKKDDTFSTDSKSSGITGKFLLKFYFSPNKGGDKFYGFPYFRYSSRSSTFYDSSTSTDITATYKAIGAGLGLGYKWVSDGGFLLDFGLGVGKNFSGGFTYSEATYVPTITIPVFPINFVSRISIGYRF